MSELPLYTPVRARPLVPPELESNNIGVPGSYENAPPWTLTVWLCLGPFGGPRGGGLFL